MNVDVRLLTSIHEQTHAQNTCTILELEGRVVLLGHGLVCVIVIVLGAKVLLQDLRGLPVHLCICMLLQCLQLRPLSARRVKCMTHVFKTTAGLDRLDGRVADAVQDVAQGWSA